MPSIFAQICRQSKLARTVARALAPNSRRERSIIKESDNSAAQGLAIMIRNNESVMQMADTLGAAGEGNDRFSSEHVVQEASPDDRGIRAAERPQTSASAR